MSDSGQPVEAGENQPQAVQAKQFKCQGCGADMRFDPKAGKQKCPFCGHEHDVPQSESEIKELDFLEFLSGAAGREETIEQQTVQCRDCGAETTLAPNVTTDKCAFCGSPVVASETSKKLIKPKSLLPFKISQAQAHESFQKWIAGLWFAPNKLKELARRDQPINGIYVPYWTYDSNTTSYYRGERGEYYYVTESYTDSQGKSQTRRVRKIRWWPASGVVYDSFDDVLVLASKSLPQKYAERLPPWDLEHLAPYGDEYLAGFRTESYQVDLAQGFERAKEIMDGTIRESVRRDIGGDEQRIHSIRTQYDDITFKHILLPIWISAYRYLEKAYRFLVNGRTGKVQGERPWSWVKIGLLVLGILAILGVILFFATRG